MSKECLYHGKCLCGNVTIEASDEPLWVGHCHCPSCQKATSAGFATYVGFKNGAVHVKGDTLTTYHSSPGVDRQFCHKCGSPVSFQGAAWPDELHIHIGLFDNPADFTPTGHTYVKTKLPWVKLDEGLEQHDMFSPEDMKR